MSKVLLLGLVSSLLSTVALAKRPTRSLQLLNIFGRHAVGYEALAVTRFEHNLHGQPHFYLDPQYGRTVAIAEQRLGLFPQRFSILTADDQQHIDLNELNHRGIVSDFLALDRLPGFLFTPHHYVFWGRHKVYLVNRQHLTIEMVASHQDSSHYQVVRSQLLTDNLIVAHYRNDDHEEYLQFISTTDLAVSQQQQVRGTLLAVTDEFIISQQGSTLIVVNHRQRQQQLYTVFDPIDVQLTDKLLIVASSDKTLSLINLATKRLQRVTLDNDTSLIIAKERKVIMQPTDDALYLTYGRQLSKVKTSSQDVWHRQLPEDPRQLLVIDYQKYLLVVSVNQINVIDQSGQTILGIDTVADQHFEKVTFVDRYLNLIVENNFHHAGQLQFDLVQFPLVRLLKLLERFPLLQEITRFTLSPLHATFSDFILTAVESFLRDNPNWPNKNPNWPNRQQLLQLVKTLTTPLSLPNIESYLEDHG